MRCLMAGIRSFARRISVSAVDRVRCSIARLALKVPTRAGRNSRFAHAGDPRLTVTTVALKPANHHASVVSSSYELWQFSVVELSMRARKVTALISGMLVVFPMMAAAKSAAPSTPEKDQVLAVMHAVVDAWNKTPGA